MKDFPNILGNEELRERLAADVREGTLSHAYIIEGARGSGKHTLARELAAALACEHSKDTSLPLPCSLCPSCRKIMENKSPDVITISREEGKAQLGVDIIRRLRDDVRLLPNDLDIKVYILEDAHTMNIQAQNAFLLTLEEPPKFVVFLLLAESASPLLETIKSRAPILRMRPLPRDILGANLLRMNSDAAALKRDKPEEFEEIIKLASGYIGQALELLDEKKRRPRLDARHLAKNFLEEMTTRRNGKRSIDLIGMFSQKRDEIIKQLSEIENAARDLIVIKKCEGAPLCFFTSEEEAAELSFKFKASALLGIMNAIGKAKTRLAGNSNVRLTLYALAIDCGLL
ncbi:MAG: DNA polymerase III subunit [Clostridia bacterium]|nr:DNA polymerase III subunit [Clostridia bacterium]